MKQCKHCNQIFQNIVPRAFSNHVRWCHANPKNARNKVKCKHCNQQICQYQLQQHESICLLRKTTCKQCNCIFFKDDSEQQFCSHGCAGTNSNRTRIQNGWKMSEQTKNKIGQALINRSDLIGRKVPKQRNCAFCNNIFQPKMLISQCCSKHCRGKLRSSKLDKDKLKDYRLLCKFSFGIGSYPQQFDFDLIKQYGWYKAKNRGDNPNGVSRDHMVSVKYGFQNKIDPKVISHPANCKLMRHNDNVSKHLSCSITIQQLNQRIKNWDSKYKKHD